MAVSDGFLAFVLEQLNGIRDVTSRRMFGGIGVYAGDRFFAVLDNNALFFKVDDQTRPQYIAQGAGPFRPDPRGPAMNGYYQVPASVLEDADALTTWARRAIAVSAAAPATRKRRTR